MKIKSCAPEKLPIKNLRWDQLISFAGEAREAVARYDETVKKRPTSLLEIFKWREMPSSLKGLNFAIDWAKKAPLNASFFCHVHAIVKRDASDPKEVGSFRKKQNWIGPHGRPIEDAYFLPPEPKKVKIYMTRLNKYWNTKEKEPLIQIAIFFAQFLAIHPFMDGNGRLARIFVPVALWKRGLTSAPILFLSSYFEQHRLQYFQKLFDVSETQSWEEWIQFFLKGVKEQSLRLKSQAEQIHQLYDELSSKTSPRQALCLFEDAFFQLTKKKILTKLPREHTLCARLLKIIQ